jgi:hypothetical protein
MAAQCVNIVLFFVIFNHVIRIYAYGVPEIYPETEFRIASPIDFMTKSLFNMEFEEAKKQPISYTNLIEEIRRRYTLGGAHIVGIALLLLVLVLC